jgi:hypothetical protein
MVAFSASTAKPTGPMSSRNAVHDGALPVPGAAEACVRGPGPPPMTHSEPTAPLRERMRLTFSRRIVSLQSVGKRWAPTASDIEGPTDLDWVSLCFETEISRCALDSCHGPGALELSVNRQCLSKCGEPSSVVKIRCHSSRDRVPASATQILGAGEWAEASKVLDSREDLILNRSQ